MKSQKSYNWLMVIFVVLLAVIPLVMVSDSAFGGADGLAEEAIIEMSPDFTPWFEPILEPPGDETESLLFALQAALGAGVIGYIIGLFKGRSAAPKGKDTNVA